MKKIYAMFYSALLALLFMPLGASAQLQLYGGLMSSDEWTGYSKPYGIYTFPAQSGTSFTALHTDYFNFEMQGGGVVVDSTCYVVNYYDFGSSPYVYYSGYNIGNWSEASSQSGSGQSLIPTALAYDASTGNVYGSFRNSSNSGYELGTVDVTAAKRTSTIASLGKQPFVALGVSKTGELYGVRQDGTFYSINKANGELAAIGTTGVTPSTDGYQSGTIYRPTNVFYWAATRSDGTSGLYTVDLKSGKATLVSEFPHKEQVAMLYVPTPAAEDDAPAAPTGLALNFPNGAVSGTIDFTVPTTTFAGGALSGNVAYAVVADNDTIARGTARPGAKVQAHASLSNGSHDVVVALSNAAGSSPVAKTSGWIGFDDPRPVSGLSLTIDDKGNASLKWSAPTSGVHNGYLSNNLQYIVRRYPDESATTVSSTSLSETLEKGELKAYYYTVTAVNGVHQSSAARSNAVAYGNALSVPYDENFQSGTASSFFTIIDNNQDNYPWRISTSQKAAVYYSNDDAAADDWLITPAIHLEAGHTYVFSMDFHGYSNYFDEKLAVAYGTGLTPSSYTTVTADTTFASKSNLNTTKSITVSETGDYHFGVHAISEEGGQGIFVTDINVQDKSKYVAPEKPKSNAAPKAPTNLKATYDGGKVALSWTASKLDVEGNEMDPDSITYYVMRVSTDASIPDTILAHVKGTSYTDILNVNGKNAKYQYAVVAANGKTIGTAMAYSNYIAGGKALDYPFHESFFLGSEDNEGWDQSRSNGVMGWLNTDRASEDDDDGSMEFYPITTGKYAILSSGKINFRNASAPYLTYHYYALPDSDVQYYVKAYNNRNDSVVSPVIDCKTLNGTAGWRMASLPLFTLLGSEYVYFDFYAVVGDKSTARIDRVDVFDAKDNDVVAEFVTAPNRVKANSTHEAKVKVSNFGASGASAFSVDLLLDGKVIASKDVDGIPSFDDTTLSFQFTPAVTVGDSIELKAVARYDDEDAANNTSRAKMVRVDKTSLPTVQLSGNKTATGISLSWKEPSEMASSPIVDGFEDYDHWSTSDFGGYLTYDGTGTHTYMITGHTEVANSGKPFAFEVFNPLYAGIDVESETNYAPQQQNGGEQYLLSLCAAPDYEGGAAPTTDHWIISPKVQGGQTISLWAKSITKDFPETFQILYSSTDTAITSFKAVSVTKVAGTGGSNKISNVWWQYTAELPADAKYFAVRHVSNNMFGLALDNFSYIPAKPELIGYNVYCDNEKIASLLPGQNTYSVSNPSGHYTVSAVYDQGESPASNQYAVATGITTISVDARGNADGGWYNLQGVRMQNPQHGVFIHNGKKVVLK